MEFFFLWFVFCIIPAVIASTKGRSALGWFSASVFISPLLGGIIVACLKPATATLEQRELASGRMRKCPHCAELVKCEAKICRYCQRELDPPIEAPPPPIISGIPVASIPKTCPRCASPSLRAITEGRIYHCGPCGNDFEVIA